MAWTETGLKTWILLSVDTLNPLLEERERKKKKERERVRKKERKRERKKEQAR